MATTVISNSLTNPSSDPAPDFFVNARLMTLSGQTGGFRLSTGSTEIASVVTTAASSGTWSLALENNANIIPSQSFYVIEELVPSSFGGTREWPCISSTSALTQTLYEALANPIPSGGGSYGLTRSLADSLYGQLAAANIWTSSNTFTGPVSFTGSETHTGTESHSGTVNFTGTVNIATSTVIGVPGLPPGWFNITDYGAVATTSQDNSSFIKTTADLANAVGGVVYTPPGVFGCNQILDFKDYRSVTFRGTNGGDGGKPGSEWLLTSSSAGARFVDLRNGRGCGIEDMVIRHNSTAFTDNLVDFSLTGIGGGYGNYMRNVALIGPGLGLGSADFIYTEGTYGTVLDHVHFSHYNNGVVMTTPGSTGGIGGGGLLTMFVPQFDGHSDGAPILNPTVSVSVFGGTVEPALTVGSTELSASFISHDIIASSSRGYPKNIVVKGVWFGDASTGNHWIDADGGGYDLCGNYVTLPNNCSFVAASTTVNGLTMRGNTFFGSGSGLNCGAQTNLVNIDVGGNQLIGTGGTGSQVKEDHTVGASYGIAQNGTGPHNVWRQDINCLVTPSLASGGFTSVFASTGINLANAYRFATAQNALVEWDTVLSASTSWSLEMWHVSEASAGIYSVMLDSTANIVATIQGYSTGTVLNAYTTTAPFTVPLSGNHKLRLQMLTKSTASGGFDGSPVWLTLQRNA